MGIGPTPAIEKVLSQTGLQKEEVDTWEVSQFYSRIKYHSLSHKVVRSMKPLLHNLLYV